MTDDRFFSFPPAYRPCMSDDRSAALIKDNYIDTTIGSAIYAFSSDSNAP